MIAETPSREQINGRVCGLLFVCLQLQATAGCTGGGTGKDAVILTGGVKSWVLNGLQHAVHNHSCGSRGDGAVTVGDQT